MKSADINPLQGYSLLEMMLAMSILGIMGLMVFGSFQSLVDASTRAENALDSLYVSEIIMDQIEHSLKMAEYDSRDQRNYRFIHENIDSDYPVDTFSWVSSASDFLPSAFPTREGVNRIELTVEEQDGESGLSVRAFSSLYDPESPEAEDVEPWIVSRQVVGIDLNFYDVNEQDWTEDWERDNQIPVSIILTLYLKVDGSDPQKVKTFHRRIDIPVGEISRKVRRGERAAEETP